MALPKQHTMIKTMSCSTSPQLVTHHKKPINQLCTLTWSQIGSHLSTHEKITSFRLICKNARDAMLTQPQEMPLQDANIDQIMRMPSLIKRAHFSGIILVVTTPNKLKMQIEALEKHLNQEKRSCVTKVQFIFPKAQRRTCATFDNSARVGKLLHSLPNVSHLCFKGMLRVSPGMMHLVESLHAQVKHLELFRKYSRYMENANVSLPNLPLLETFRGDCGMVALFRTCSTSEEYNPNDTEITYPNLTLYEGAFNMEAMDRLIHIRDLLVADDTSQTTHMPQIHLKLTKNNSSIRIPKPIQDAITAVEFQYQLSSLQELHRQLIFFHRATSVTMAIHSDLIDNTPHEDIFATEPFPQVEYIAFVDLDYPSPVGLKRNLIKLLHLFPRAKGMELLKTPHRKGKKSTVGQSNLSIHEIRITLGHLLKVNQGYYGGRTGENMSAFLIEQFNMLATILHLGQIGSPEYKKRKWVLLLHPIIVSYYQYCYGFP